jgi:peptide/nickel transport system substrate-binding protein
VNPASARQIDRSRAVRLEPIPADAVVSAFLNPQRPQLSDARVRQALAWAVDREELVELAHDGWSAPAPSWLATNPSYPEANRMGFTRQDVTEAAQLLDAAGWRLAPGSRVRTKDGVPLRVQLLWFLTYRPLAEALQAQWGKIGVDVEVQGTGDYAFVTSRREAGDWDAFLVGWGTFGDPAAVLSRHVGANGDVNYARLVDPVFEELLAGFAPLADPEERRQQALKVNARHAEVVPFIPLTQYWELNAVSRKLRNYIPHFLPWVYQVHPDLWVAA